MVGLDLEFDTSLRMGWWPAMHDLQKQVGGLLGFLCLVWFWGAATGQIAPLS
jgi:hypothetical protein